MYPREINSPLSRFSAKVLHSYLGFPEGKSITALDFKAGNGDSLIELTQGASEAFLYGIEPNRYQAQVASERFVRVSNSEYKSSSKITNEAFSLALVNPIINPRFLDDIFSSYDPFQIPDFEEEERQRIKGIEAQKEQLDLGQEGVSEEERAKQQEEIEKKIQKAIEERNIAYRRALREQEKRTEMFRDDKFLLANATKYLMPRGILVFVTPKEFIDGQIVFKLANNFEDIQIFRLDDYEYVDQRKCIILARKRLRVERQDTLPYVLMQTKYKPWKEIPVISPQSVPMYQVPVKHKDDVTNFRVGPITMEEALSVLKRSPVVENFAAMHSMTLDNVTPKPPTQLHKGHVSLTLASGLLNGYIGAGADRHLVKGSVVKQSSEFEEEVETDDGTETKTVEREYFNVGIKFLDRSGTFHKLL